MDFMDEKIIELRNKNRKKSLEDGVLIKGELVEFEPVKLFGEKLEVMLPKSFIDMPIDMTKIKYPSENRPQIIKTDKTGSINFCFNLFDQSVKNDELKEVAKTFSKMIKKVNPANVFYEQKTEELGDKLVSWFDFKGYAIDSQIYYIYYVTVIDGKLLHGIFNCLRDDMEYYKEVAFLVIKSIKDLSMR